MLLYKIGNMSQLQQTLCSEQQLIKMMNLQEYWVTNLVRKGRSKDLGELLKKIPLIKRLSEEGLYICLRFDERIEVIEVDDLEHALAQNVKEESEQSKSHNSSDQTSLLQAYESALVSEVNAFDKRKEAGLSPIQRLNKMAIGLKMYLKNTSRILTSHFEDLNLSAMNIQAVSFYQTYAMQVFRSYLDFEIQAFKMFDCFRLKFQRSQQTRRLNTIVSQEFIQINEKKGRERSSRQNSQEKESVGKRRRKKRNCSQ